MDDDKPSAAPSKSEKADKKARAELY